MTIFQSLCHYIIFAVQVICFGFMGAVVCIGVGVVFMPLVGWLLGCLFVAIGCWAYANTVNEYRTLYPHCWPTPKY